MYDVEMKACARCSSAVFPCWCVLDEIRGVGFAGALFNAMTGKSKLKMEETRALLEVNEEATRRLHDARREVAHLKAKVEKLEERSQAAVGQLRYVEERLTELRGGDGTSPRGWTLGNATEDIDEVIRGLEVLFL